MVKLWRILFWSVLTVLAGCAGKGDIYRDPNMDFGAVQTVAVLPFSNLTRDSLAADRVRDVFINKLLSTGAVYVVPTGEVARGEAMAEIQNPFSPSPAEIVKLGPIIKCQAVIIGVVKEYGEVRSGTTSDNLISLSLQMIETQTGKIVWTASTTKGGITTWDRLFGGGGQAMNDVTEKAVNDLVNKLFK
jgi:hypothetical protein